MGLMGSEKSTISRALANSIKGDSLEELRTFGNDETPIVNIDSKPKNVSVFNQEYVDTNICFKKILLIIRLKF